MIRSLITISLLATPLTAQQPTLGSRTVPILTQDGITFRDLNRSGALDPFEDWRRTPDARAADLVSRMTLEEKAGAMMHGTARATGGPMGAAGVGGGYDADANRTAFTQRHLNSMITRLSGAPSFLAAQNNGLQAIAESSRLGIPVTISTDPRHHFQEVFGASTAAHGFSQWPETLGLAAARDPSLVRHFGDVARQEFRAVGIHMTLSPQADLATEPRWSRVNGTFGEDADLVGPLVRAYVEGFQHGSGGTTRDGVLAVVKHWVGYGAARDGFDSHNAYGKTATFTGDNLDYHIKPFLGAFAARVAGVMPTYSILENATWKGAPIEAVGAGYNRQLLTDMLRGQYGYRGLIVSDWLITADCGPLCLNGVPAGTRPSFEHVAMPWGVEQLTRDERFVKAVLAGIDQFGGVEDSDILVKAVREGKLTEARLGESAQRVMADKFRLGLFENPYVDTLAANSLVGAPAFVAAADEAQRRSLVLLENVRNVLPLKASGTRVYLKGVARAEAERRGFEVVDDPSRAQVAIVRTNAPFETLHPGYMFGSMMHEGNLAFREGDAEFEAIRKICDAVPTILTVYLDRPAVLTALKDRVRALIANFGVSDAVLLDMLEGKAQFGGKLPFELPSSMAAVLAQRPDRPHDSEKPLYPIGFGRR